MASPATILIVDDDCVLAENLRAYLVRGGRDVRVAADARQAKAILASFSPEAVVLDYGLPDIDGLRLYTEIVRPLAPHAGCVLMTGGLTDRVASEAGKQGIRSLLEKPFSLVDLQRHLERLSEPPPPLPPASALPPELKQWRARVQSVRRRMWKAYYSFFASVGWDRERFSVGQ